MSEQSNERVEADIALRSIASRAANRIEADSYDLGFLRGQAELIGIHFDHDPALMVLATSAINQLRERSVYRVN